MSKLTIYAVAAGGAGRAPLRAAPAGPLVERMAAQKTVGVLLFDGFESLDVFGPVEAWGLLAAGGDWRVVTTAESAGPVASAQHVRAVADHALADCPPLDVIVVPGGIGTRRLVANEAVLAWLRARAAHATAVTSVCTGAGVLARAGLLDGRRATTNKLSFAWVVEQGPRVHWVREARWVEDGAFVTSAGVSAGIDMTCAVIAKLVSPQAAERVAARMEYEWHRDANWDPFAKLAGLV
jgi:transcriptional regulator GlxA family with amidase domain